jgi:hypothetical protein
MALSARVPGRAWEPAAQNGQWSAAGLTALAARAEEEVLQAIVAARVR